MLSTRTALLTALAAAPLVAAAPTVKTPKSRPVQGHNSPNATHGAQDNSHTYYCTALSTSKLLAFTGNMVVPSGNPDAGGTSYLWPGLQPADDSLVLQPVLDGAGDSWTTYQNYLVGGSFGDTMGQSVSCGPNDNLPFSMTIASDGNSWNIVATNAQGQTATNNWNPAVTFTQAFFCAEFYTANFDFGPLAFSDVQVVGSGSDCSWCTAGTSGNTALTWGSFSSSTDSNGNCVCSVSSLSMVPS